MKFLKKLDHYHEYGKLRNYLYVVAKNSITDYFRKPEEPVLVNAEEAVYDGGLEAMRERMDILHMLNSLEPFEKELIILRYYQELKIRDMSRILDIPASTVRYRLKNAEKILRVRLEL